MERASSFLVTGLLFGCLSIVINWIAKALHFFEIHHSPQKRLRFKFPIWGLIGYILLFFLSPFIGLQFIPSSLKEIFVHSPPLLTTFFQLCSISFMTAYLVFFSVIQDRETIQSIWVGHRSFLTRLFFKDFGIGVLTWILAFPTVTFISQICELTIYHMTGLTSGEQTALKYLLMVTESPYLLSIALFSILIAAPLIEEFVFRGFLYSYLKGKVGMKKALFISSLLFALMHFNLGQGIGNFTLLLSLFTFAVYLGFLYEKRSSLVAPIALHMTFNSISVMRILIFSN